MKATLPILGVLALALAACDKPVTTCESGDTSCDTGSTVVPLPTYSWDNDGLNISVDNNPGTGFDLGLAETGSTGDGWFGEDCFNGTAGYEYCHSFSGNSGSLSAVATPDEVVAGSTTLLNVGLAYNDGGASDRITYMMTLDGGVCLTWGEDPGYYSSFNCTVYGE